MATVYQKHRIMQNFNNEVYDLTLVRCRKVNANCLIAFGISSGKRRL